jgi:aldose sugar dehydrogenase
MVEIVICSSPLFKGKLHYNLLKITFIYFFILGIALPFAYGQPSVNDEKMKVERIVQTQFQASTIAFNNDNDFFILDRNEGKVYRVLNGKFNSDPLLDVTIATDGYRGLLGISVDKNKSLVTNNSITNVYLYFTEGKTHDGDDQAKTNPQIPLGNRLYKYELKDNKLVEPKLLLDLPALPGPRHPGGIVEIGPDNNLYVTVGDIDGTFREKYQTLAQNYRNGSSPDGRSGILRVTQDGKPIGNGIIGNDFPLNLYFAYGIRNSFGIDWDPMTGNLWDTENGPHYGDEINLVEPGFNSGWAVVQGLWKPDLDERGKLLSDLPPNLVDFDDSGNYSPPELVWNTPIAPTAIKFYNSEKMGNVYENDLFVADANTGSIYHFDLNENRSGLLLHGPLKDKIVEDFSELSGVIFAKGFGRITDMEVGPDGYFYVVSSEDNGTVVYRITKI